MIPAVPLPTRVNRACDRCKRNKSRCDSFRPCSLCLRASAQCRTTESKGSNGSRQISTPAQRPLTVAPEPASDTPRKRQRRDYGSNGAVHGNQESPTVHADAQSVGPRQTQAPDAAPHELPDVGGDSVISIARKISTLQRQPTREHAVGAIPGANDSPIAHTTYNSAPIKSYVTYDLPEMELLDELLEEYFNTVHWFSLVILEPKFRIALGAIRGGYATPYERPFLLLLSTILGLAAWYRAHDVSEETKTAAYDWLSLSKKMIANAESQMIDLMDQPSVTTIQTLILLGSYYVYHGRPNLSFSLLGATIKAAQSIGLHQHSAQTSDHDQEERKRVWWTIYTWDRFATVNHGRPLSISENVCSVQQPDDIYESPIFGVTVTPGRQRSICYSPYQRELNRLYLVASPAIERVYRAPRDQQLKTAEEYHMLVNDVTTRLWQWRNDLPEHLRLSAESDWPIHLQAEDKAYRLQSLSLYLTFDSVVLILHRPFMKQRLDSVLAESSPQSYTTSAPYNSSGAGQKDLQDTSSHGHLWNAAVRTAKLTELPELAQHATDGHLVVFMVINLFNAAVVLIVMALSDPLADRAQEAKRAVARIYRLQTALASRSVVSQQCSAVLRGLIQLLISRESDAILSPLANTERRATPGEGPGFENAHPPQSISVRDALSMPLHTGFVGENDVVWPEGSTAKGMAGRLDLSLESVQRAFTAAPNDAFGSGRPSRRSSKPNLAVSQQEEVDATLPAEDLSGPIGDFPMSVDWSAFNGGSDNGMHWIWDPAWDNLFSSMDA